MALRTVALVLSGAVAAANGLVTGRAAQQVTPVEKVVELLKGLQAKVEEEGKTDAAQYDKFACFCKEQLDNKNYAIEKSTEKIASLGAKSAQLSTEISELNAEITSLNAQIKSLQEDIKAATAVRAQEHAAYLLQEKDAADAIQALENAIAALKGSKAALSSAKVDFMQVKAAVSRASSLIDISDLEQMIQDPTKYEYQGNDIIATLEGMLKTFNENKKQLDIDEFDTQASYDRRNLDLTNQKKFLSKDKAQREKVLESKTAENNAVLAEQSQEVKDKTADETFLKVVVKECEAKAGLWDQRSQLRQGELTAIAEALEQLTTKVAGAYEANKKLNLAQLSSKPAAKKDAKVAPKSAAAPAKKVVSFLQLASASGAASTVQHAAQVLELAAGRLHSQMLYTVATRLRVEADHFAKVRSLVKDLIAKLEEEKASEASQKAFCDEAMAAAIDASDKAQSEVEQLHATKAALTAEKAELAQSIANLSKAIAALKKGLLEATELRQKESAENAETVATATEGKSAVGLALKSLNDFYNKAGFLQTKARYVPEDAGRDGQNFADVAPEVFQGSYGGASKSATGIIGLLEVIESDFDRTIATVTEQEAKAQADFDAYAASTQADIADKEGAIDAARARVSAIEDELVSTEDKLAEQSELLESAKATLLELKAQCVDAEESYEEKVAKRKKEIESLKEAKAILDEYSL